MFTTLFALTLLFSIVHSVFAQSGFSIDTPNLVQCQPTQVTWTDDGYGPYDLLIVSADDVCGPALEDLGNQTSTALTWTVNLAAGTQVVISLEDSAGNEAWSGTITVGPSNDTSCLASSSSGSTPSGTTPTPAPSVAPATSAGNSSPTSSAFSPAGAANAGLGSSSSGALSTRPLSAVTLLTAVFAVVVSAL